MTNSRKGDIHPRRLTNSRQGKAVVDKLAIVGSPVLSNVPANGNQSIGHNISNCKRQNCMTCPNFISNSSFTSTILFPFIAMLIRIDIIKTILYLFISKRIKSYSKRSFPKDIIPIFFHNKSTELLRLPSILGCPEIKSLPPIELQTEKNKPVKHTVSVKQSEIPFLIIKKQ